ncbi:MAG: CDP-2,3-bis-(O-geranylgeranyl)-sn-glycerol synthase [Promethearchaeati archaeon SRVP18_Atabeyarchaeia-1]
MDIWTVALSFWFVFPAYAANAVPVLVGGGKPMDFGRDFFDGRRVFGDGKTIRGFAGGIIGGLLVGIFESFVSSRVIFELGKLTILSSISIETLQCTLSRALLLSLGALTGDLLGSFIKRRMGFRRGAPAPVLDQLTFLVVAFALVSFVFPVPWEYVIILVVATPLIHLLTNGLSYLLGLKRVPW